MNILKPTSTASSACFLTRTVRNCKSLLGPGSKADEYDAGLRRNLFQFKIRNYNQYGFGFNKQQYTEVEEKKKKLQRQKDCLTLNLPENCYDETLVRNSYVALVKKYHPDGGTSQADAEKFQQVDKAYKNLQRDFAEFRIHQRKIEEEQANAKSGENENVEEGPDIKHTAPQHRQYLSFDGVGSGTPSQREKQFIKHRRAKAVENVMEYRVQKLTSSSGEEVWELAKDVRAAKKTKTGIGIDRLVEDLIQESMARGDFKNLSGEGKPLKHDSSYNPYVDFTTHKLNQVLIENGFAPEWIMLEKEIREEIRRLRKEISFVRHKYNAILSPNEENDWKEVVSEFKNDCDKLNKMILKFNLTVPSLSKQMMTFQLDREATKALSTFSPEIQNKFNTQAAYRKENTVKPKRASHSDSDSFIGMLLSIFKT